MKPDDIFWLCFWGILAFGWSLNEFFEYLTKAAYYKYQSPVEIEQEKTIQEKIKAGIYKEYDAEDNEV